MANQSDLSKLLLSSPIGCFLLSKLRKHGDDVGQAPMLVDKQFGEEKTPPLKQNSQESQTVYGH